MPECIYCKPEKKCWIHQLYVRTCGCGVEYVGTRQNQGCASCTIDRIDERNRKRLAARSAKGYVEKDQIEKERKCRQCGETFFGTNSAKFCKGCKIHNYTTRLDRQRSDQQFFRSEKITPRKMPVTKPGSKLPPPCQVCHFGKETDQYESGMICLAESYLRCSPWAPGAQPLKRRENA